MYAKKTVTESTLIKTGATGLAAVLVTAGADAASVILYDNTAGSGTVICAVKAAAAASATFCPAGPISCSNGVYATVSGTTPSVTVIYG